MTTEQPSAAFMAESKAPMLYAALWTFTTLAAVFVSARIYVRSRLVKMFGVDDFLIAIAWLFLAIFVSIDTYSTTLGLGRHLVYLLETSPPENLVNLVFYIWLGNSFAVMAASIGKSSFAFTLMRIMPQLWVRVFLWSVVVVMNVTSAILVIMIYAQCRDARTVWNPIQYPSECWPTSVLTNFAIFVGAFAAASDFCLAALPWTILPQLQMRVRDKIGVAIAMSLGAVAGSSAIVKTVNLEVLTLTDATYGQPDLVVWGCIEISLTIIAGSIPTLRPLLRKLFPTSTADASDPNQNSYHMNRLGSKDQFNNPAKGVTNTLVTIGSKMSRPKLGGGQLDDDSDKSILHSDREGIQIKTTREVHVQYD